MYRKVDIAMRDEDFEPLKPVSNTSSIRAGQSILIDYIILSFVQADMASIVNYFFYYLLDSFELLDSHMRGFQKMYTNEKIFVHYENKGNKAVVLVEIRACGCRFLEQQEEHTWFSFFRQVSEIVDMIPVERVNIKRIDIAIDSFSKETLTPTRALDYIKRQLVTSRFQTGRIIHEFRIKTTELTGESFYFGKRASDLSVVVYDKKLETKSESEWFRTEIRFRNSWATKVVDALLEQRKDFSLFVSEVMKTNIQFRSSYHKRSELRRRPLAKWYETYLLYIKKQRLHRLD
ncbi:replication initiation factor domain-containing protein [Enterococcus crotali]